MKIYDKLIYDEIDLYMRDTRNIDSVKRRLIAWFVEGATPEDFLELINMTSFKQQNGEMADDRGIDAFKEFMSNYYLENDTITKKAYNELVKYSQQTGDFRYKTDEILSHKFATEEIFNYAIEQGFTGTNSGTMSHFFSNVQCSEKTLIKYISTDSSVKYDPLIRLQKFSKKVVDEILKTRLDRQETIIMLGQYNHDIDEKTFLDMLKDIDLNDLLSLTGERELVIAIKKMILKDRNFYEEPNKWYLISSTLKSLNSEYKAIVYSGILTYPNVNSEIMDEICSHENALGYILQKMDLNKIDSGTKLDIYERTGAEQFLPQEAKDIFLF